MVKDSSEKYDYTVLLIFIKIKKMVFLTIKIHL